MRKSPGFAGDFPKFDVSAMGADEHSLDCALIPKRRIRRGIVVERGLMEPERRIRCDIIPAWKKANMSLRRGLV
jgi:hypothetical protein